MRVNESAFAMTLNAIRQLSRRHLRYETLSGVINYTISTDIAPPFEAIEELRLGAPFDGDIQIFLRLHANKRDQFEHFRKRLQELVDFPVSARETVIFCCLLVTLSD